MAARAKGKARDLAGIVAVPIVAEIAKHGRKSWKQGEPQTAEKADKLRTRITRAAGRKAGAAILGTLVGRTAGKAEEKAIGTATRASAVGLAAKAAPKVNGDKGLSAWTPATSCSCHLLL